MNPASWPPIAAGSSFTHLLPLGENLASYVADLFPGHFTVSQQSLTLPIASPGPRRRRQKAALPEGHREAPADGRVRDDGGAGGAGGGVQPQERGEDDDGLEGQGGNSMRNILA